MEIGDWRLEIDEERGTYLSIHCIDRSAALLCSTRGRCSKSITTKQDQGLPRVDRSASLILHSISA